MTEEKTQRVGTAHALISSCIMMQGRKVFVFPYGRQPLCDNANLKSRWSQESWFTLR